MKIKTIAHFVIVTLVLILALLDLRIWKRITDLYIISNEGNHVQFGWLTDHKMCWLDKKDAFLTLEVETLLRWNPLMKRKYKSNINDVHGHVWILKCDAPSHNPGCLSGKVKHAIKKTDSTYLDFTAEYVHIFELRVHDPCGFHSMCRFQGRNTV